MTDDWITTKEAVELSNYHPDHLRELIREGKIEARKFGIVWQVSKKSLLDYIDAASKAGDRRWGAKR